MARFPLRLPSNSMVLLILSVIGMVIGVAASLLSFPAWAGLRNCFLSPSCESSTNLLQDQTNLSVLNSVFYMGIALLSLSVVVIAFLAVRSRFEEREAPPPISN